MTDGLGDLTNERMVRLLRAKAGELEARIQMRFNRDGELPDEDVVWIIADLGLLFDLMATHVERANRWQTRNGNEPGDRT